MLKILFCLSNSYTVLYNEDVFQNLKVILPSNVFCSVRMFKCGASFVIASYNKCIKLTKGRFFNLNSLIARVEYYIKFKGLCVKALRSAGRLVGLVKFVWSIEV